MPKTLADELNGMADEMATLSSELERLLAVLRPPSLRENLRVIEGGKDDA
jgi:hypothetical protein